MIPKTCRAVPGAEGAGAAGRDSLSFTFRNRKRSRCQWPLTLCGYQGPITSGETSGQQKINLKELLFIGELFKWDLLESSRVSVTREGAAEPHHHPASVTRTPGHQPHAPAQTPNEASPSHTSTFLGQRQIPSHLKGVSVSSLGKEPVSSRTSATSPCPGPSNSSSLRQAWLGMEMCSWDRNSTPEPAFGYQPWVWFEILPEENITPSSGRAFFPQTLEKVTSHQRQPFSVLQFSAHLPGEAQAAAAP